MSDFVPPILPTYVAPPPPLAPSGFKRFDAEAISKLNSSVLGVLPQSTRQGAASCASNVATGPVFSTVPVDIGYGTDEEHRDRRRRYRDDSGSEDNSVGRRRGRKRESRRRSRSCESSSRRPRRERGEDTDLSSTRRHSHRNDYDAGQRVRQWVADVPADDSLAPYGGTAHSAKEPVAAMSDPVDDLCRVRSALELSIATDFASGATSSAMASLIATIGPLATKSPAHMLVVLEVLESRMRALMVSEDVQRSSEEKQMLTLWYIFDALLKHAATDAARRRREDPSLQQMHDAAAKTTLPLAIEAMRLAIPHFTTTFIPPRLSSSSAGGVTAVNDRRRLRDKYRAMLQTWRKCVSAEIFDQVMSLFSV